MSPEPAEEPALAAGDSPGFLLWRATVRWQRLMAATLQPVGLTHTQFVLLASTYWLGRTGTRPPSQRAIADHTFSDVMMTSQVLRALESRSLVTRAADASDARVKRVLITPAGAELAQRAMGLVEAADEAFFASTLEQTGRESVLRLFRGLGDWDPTT